MRASSRRPLLRPTSLTPRSQRPKGSIVTEISVATADRPILLDNPAVSRNLGRPLAVLSLFCLLSHVPLIISHLKVAPMSTVAMGVVALACIPCARKLWTEPHTHECNVAASLAALMVVLHVSVALSMGSSDGKAMAAMPMHAHHHQVAVVASAEAPNGDVLSLPATHTMAMSPVAELLMNLATGMALLQVLLNGLVVWLTAHRFRLSQVRGQPVPA